MNSDACLASLQLEVLMTDLDPKVMRQFYKQNNKDFVSARHTTEVSFISFLASWL